MEEQCEAICSHKKERGTFARGYTTIFNAFVCRAELC